MDVLVTGGAGFIGSQVCAALRRDGLAGRLLVLDDLSTGLVSNLSGVDVELVEGSILDADLVGRLVAGVDAVVHLAAVPAVARSLQDPRASHDANATGTVVVLEAARAKDAQVVVASSSSVYGRGVAMPTPRTTRPGRPAPTRRASWPPRPTPWPTAPPSTCPSWPSASSTSSDLTRGPTTPTPPSSRLS